MSHQLLRHIFGTLCRRQRIFCVDAPWANKYEGYGAYEGSEKGHEQQARARARRGQPSNYQTSPCKESMQHKKFLGWSTTISHHLRNFVNSGLWQIQPVTRAVAFFPAAKPFWPWSLPRLLDPHKNP